MIGYRISERFITVVLDGKAYVRDYSVSLADACRDGDETRVRIALGVDPLLEPLKEYGGHLPQEPIYVIRNAEGKYWREPRKGLTDKIEDAHKYMPSQIRSVIGPKDEVTVVRT